MAENRNSSVHGEDSLQSMRQTATQPWYVRARRYCTPQVRRVKSKGAMLVTLWTYLTFISIANSQTRYGVVLKAEAMDASNEASIIGIGVVILIGPFAGLFASIYFGRYKVMRASLWLMWTGKTAIIAVLILQRFFPMTEQILYYLGILIAEVARFAGLALILVNSVPFGLDQMPDASGERISAFIHWYVWAVLAGVSTNILTDSILIITKVDDDIFLSLLSTASLSIALCTLFLLRHWLIIEPSGTNPLKMVFKVLKFAVKHNKPVRRSAFTYWENERPSRIDLAKAKYGGPFTNEEVEDVKTCLRMVVVIVSNIATILAFYCIVAGPHGGVLHAEFMDRYSKYSWQEQSFRVGFISCFCFFLSFPVYEITIHPIRKWIPSILKRVGSAQILMVAVNLILLVITTVWYTRNTTAECMFATTEPSPLPIDYHWVKTPVEILTYTSIFIFATAMLEFVCAQAPYNLRGLLIGIVYSTLLCSVSLGFGIYTIWKTGYQHNGANSPSCGVWFYLFATVTAILGCVMWCAVAKWYKKRERDEPEMCRIFAENYYDH